MKKQKMLIVFGESQKCIIFQLKSRQHAHWPYFQSVVGSVHPRSPRAKFVSVLHRFSAVLDLQNDHIPAKNINFLKNMEYSPRENLISFCYVHPPAKSTGISAFRDCTRMHRILYWPAQLAQGKRGPYAKMRFKSQKSDLDLCQ